MEKNNNNSASKFILATLLNPISKFLIKRDIIKIENLSAKNRNNLKHGAFSIFMVAFILTIFEIVFFYKIVIPGVNDSKNYGIKEIANNLSKNIINQQKNLKDDISDIEPISKDDIIKSIESDEQDKLEKQIKSIESDEQNKLEEQIKSIKSTDFDEQTKSLNLPKTNKSNDIIDTFTNLETNSSSKKKSILHNPFVKLIKNFTNDPEDFQKNKKNFLLELLDSKLPKFIPILETLYAREKRLNNKINNYVKATGVIIVLILFFFLLKLRKSVISDPEFQYYKGGYTLAKITSILTVSILILFQYTFYLLGFKYLYTINGLNNCSSEDIKAYKLYVEQKEYKNISDKEAKERILMKMIKDNSKKYYFKVNLDNISDEKCKKLKGKKENNKCVVKINYCHYLNSECDKYGTGKNELEILFTSNLTPD